jgi:hypothetical protein
MLLTCGVAKTVHGYDCTLNHSRKLNNSLRVYRDPQFDKSRSYTDSVIWWTEKRSVVRRVVARDVWGPEESSVYSQVSPYQDKFEPGTCQMQIRCSDINLLLSHTIDYPNIEHCKLALLYNGCIVNFSMSWQWWSTAFSAMNDDLAEHCIYCLALTSTSDRRE